MGGHQASCASVVQIMTALYFHALRPQDRVAVKPHASPVFHASSTFWGTQSRSQLERFRALAAPNPIPHGPRTPTMSICPRLGRAGRGDDRLRGAGPGLSEVEEPAAGVRETRSHGRHRRRRRARRGQCLGSPARKLEARHRPCLVDRRLQPAEPGQRGERSPVPCAFRGSSKRGLGGRDPEIRHAAPGGVPAARRRGAQALDRRTAPTTSIRPCASRAARAGASACGGTWPARAPRRG